MSTGPSATPGRIASPAIVTPSQCAALADRTRALLAIPSVSGSEDRITDYIFRSLSRFAHFTHERVEDCLLFLPAERRNESLVLLAGHTDTVPPQSEAPVKSLSDDLLYGVGASDMKSGLAVMMELAEWIAVGGPTLIDVGFVFFGREELAMSESNLPQLFAAAPAVRAVDLVVVLEPTDNAIQVGCLGNLNADLAIVGRGGHTARPWLALNAIHLAVERLREVVSLPYRPVTVDGLEFTESLSLTGITGGVARNVIPERVECQINFRFAPDRDPQEAVQEIKDLFEGVGELSIASVSPAGPVTRQGPLVDRLLQAGATGPAAKQAWTPVAQFGEEGLPAVCLGPGAPEQAHRADEQVSVGAICDCFRIFKRFLGTGDPQTGAPS